jgi:hypothetical protein
MELYVRVFNDMLERDKERRKKKAPPRAMHAGAGKSCFCLVVFFTLPAVKYIYL